MHEPTVLAVLDAVAAFLARRSAVHAAALPGLEAALQHDKASIRRQAATAILVGAPGTAPCARLLSTMPNTAPPLRAALPPYVDASSP